VPDVVGLEMRAARKKGSAAGVTLTAADPDGPPLGALTWPGTFIVTGQRPGPGTRIRRWGSVVVDFEPWHRGDDAGDREPRTPLPPPGALRAEADEARHEAVTDLSGESQDSPSLPEVP
jgi:hypothetical protein